MRRLVAVLLVAAALPAAALAAPGDDPVTADLDGDGAAETVAVRETSCFTPDGTPLSGALARLPLDEGVRRAGDPLKLPPRPADHQG